MARMIPDVDAASIQNRGERMFYEAASRLPDTYTIIYGYSYLQYDGEDTVREADFIIIHPTHGFLVVEVKQGETAYHAGQWHEVKQGRYVPLHKNPVEQARTAMYHILHHYKEKNRRQDFPLRSRFVLCFPESTRIAGTLPADLLRDSVWVAQDMDAMEQRIETLLTTSEHLGMPDPARQLIRILSPEVRISAALSDRILSISQTADLILTEEQERIIEETMEDKRKLFLGAAGTGKTFIAIEKARRAVQEGKKVFLTCYNKNLVGLIREQTYDMNITILNFHDFLEEALKAKQVWQAPDPNELNHYYQAALAEMGFTYYSEAAEEEKFDCILVDEGQDFREEWMLSLESMLREDGELYIFADPNQNIFGTPESWIRLKEYAVSTQRLTQNFRNTEEINQWTRPFVQGRPIKSRIQSDVPVRMHPWKDADEQKRGIEKEIGRLVSQGVAPRNIMILSPYTRAKSVLAGNHKIKEWPLHDYSRDAHEAGVQFATIRSFKGLEADIVFLIDIKEGSRACTVPDVYVGASRARALLHVFHHEDWSLPETSE